MIIYFFQRLDTLEHHHLLVQKHMSETDLKIDEILTRLEDKECEPIEAFSQMHQDPETILSRLK